MDEGHTRGSEVDDDPGSRASLALHGELIRDRYQPLAVMGRGGQGEVLRALDTQHGRPVALKIRHVFDQAGRQAILAEARILLSLGAHPNLPLVREDFFWGDRYVLAMDWVEGADLGRLLVETGDPGLHVSSVIGWLSQAADALGYLHAQGVVHGDVKPANLVLTPDGRVVLVDFGISTRPGDSPGPALGSPGYAAPELGAGGTLSPAADVYGLAATAVALLTGAPPSGGRPVWDGVPNATAIERALRRGLAVDPSRRPRTASELVERLRTHLSLDYPSGVVTFLLTDIEGSTVLWETDADAMADRLVAHDEIMADAVESHGGRLLKARGEGDSTFSVFTRVTDAVGAALVSQTRLGETGLPVRMAIHTGEAQVRSGDYFGRTVNRASRLRSIARGGQVLLSGAAAELAVETLPEGAQLVDMGFQELRDLSRGEQVFALAHPALVAVAPTMPLAEFQPAPSPPPPSPAPLPLVPVAAPTAASAPGRAPSVVPTRFPSALAVLRAGSFVGRAEERRRLAAAWDDIGRGERRVVLLGGEPGIGKTMLAAEVAGELHAGGATVLHGRCDEGLQVPYQPFAAALAQAIDDASASGTAPPLGRLAGELARLAPDLPERVPGLAPPTRADPDTEQYRLFDAVAGWLVASARANPLVLVVDDLHWATRATLHLLRHVVRLSDSAPLLIVATYRDTELARNHPLNELLADFHRMTGVERLVLGGFDHDEVLALAEAKAEHPLGLSGIGLAKQLHAETDGNPFFVRELIRHLVDSGTIPRDGDGRWVVPAGVSALGVPEGVREVVGRRLARLSDDAGRVLELAALIGFDFELPIVAAASGLDEDTALGAVEEAVASRLIHETGPLRFRFAQNLVRATIIASTAQARRTRAHRRVAEAIERLHSDDLDQHIGALARHYAEAASAGGAEKAFEYATKAGDLALARLANDEAVACYRLARELLVKTTNPVDEQTRGRLLLSLGEAQRRVGDPEARETLLESGSIAVRWRDARLAAAAALAATRVAETVAGDVDRGRVRLVESALELVGPDDSEDRARLLASLALELAWHPDTTRRDALLDEALATARRVGDPATVAWALVTRTKVQRPPSDVGQREAEARELTDLVARVEDASLAIQARLASADAAIAAGQLADADRELRAAAALADDLGQPSLRWLVLVANARQATARGLFDEAERLADEALRLAPPGLVDPTLVHLGQRLALRAMQGRIVDIAEAVAQAARQDPEISPFVVGTALAALEAGRGEDALMAFAALAADEFAAVASNHCWVVGASLASLVCFRLGDAGAAAVLRAQLAPYRGQWAIDRASIAGPVSAAIGRLAAVQRDWDEMESAFAEAVESAEEAGARPWVAVCRLEHAVALLLRGDKSDTERICALIDGVIPTAVDLGMGEVLRSAQAIAAMVGRAVPAPTGAVGAATVAQAETVERSSLPELVAADRPPMVGRRAELDRLDGLWRAAALGARSMVVITGDPGIGKTRLAVEIARRAHADGAVVLGASAQLGPGVPYQPIRSIIRDLIGAGGASPFGEKTNASDARPERPSERDGGDPVVERQRLFNGVAQFLDVAAGGRPLVMVIDDVKPSDQPTLLLARHLVEQHAAASGLLLLATVDTVGVGDAAALGLAPDRSDHIALTGFDASAVAALIVQQLGIEPGAGANESTDRDVLSTLANDITNVTGGNPLFVAELIDHLTSEGHVLLEGGRLVAAPGAAQPITGPDGLRRVLRTRIDALSPAGSRVLAAGAVLGSDFGDAAVRAVLSDDDAVVGAALNDARRARLLVEVATPDGARLAFAHAVVRDVVYDALDPIERQRLHLRAAQALEANVPQELLDAWAPALAVHYRLAGGAGDPDRAVEWAIRAAHQASRVFAFEESAAQFESAAATLADLGGAANDLRRARLLARLANIRYFSGSDAGAAVRCAEEALELFEQHGDTTRAAKLHSQLGTYFTTVGVGALDIDRALAHFAAAEPALAHGRDRAAGYYYLGVANASLRALQLGAVDKATATALEIAQEQRSRSLWANAALVAGLARWERGELAAGGVLIERAWRVADVLDQPVLTMLASWNRGNQLFALDELDRAMEWFRRDLDTARFTDAPRAAAVMAANIDRCRFELGRLDEIDGPLVVSGSDAIGDWAPAIVNGPKAHIAARLESLVARTRANGDRWSLLWHIPTVVAGFRVAGDLERAAALAAEGVALAADVDAVPLETLIRCEQSHVLAGLGRGGEASDAAARARALIGDERYWGNVAERVSHAEAVAQSASGRHASADSNFQSALDGARTTGRIWAEAAVLGDWGRSLARRGDEGGAAGRFDQARFIYHRIGAAPHWTEGFSTQ